MPSHDDISALMEEAYRALDADDVTGALEIGGKLKAMRHSSAFEVLALAHTARGDQKKAIAVLEEGVGHAPDVWLLWQLLGNYRSDQGDFLRAGDAYSRALRCPQVDVASVRYNQGAALLRAAKYQAALDTLDQTLDSTDVERQLWLLSASLRMNALNNLTRYHGAVKIGKEALSALDPGDSPEATAGVKAELA